jgi:hypothetical protein
MNEWLIKSKTARRVSAITRVGWMPISDAPESSEPFLAYCAPSRADVGTIGLGQRKFVTDGEVRDWHWSEVHFQPLQFVPAMIFDGPEFPCERRANITPTHWMPLPLPPRDSDRLPKGENAEGG